MVGKNKKHLDVNHNTVRKAEEKLQDRIKELSAIYKTSKSITSSVDVDEILSLILDSTFNIIAPDGCLMYLHKPALNTFILKTSRGIDGISNLQKLNTLDKDGIFKQRIVVERKELFVINDISNLEKEARNELYELKIKSFASIPLLRDSKVMGLFVTFSAEKGFFNKDQIRILKMFSKQAAIAIQNAELLEKTQLNYLNTIKTLANIIEVKDSSTYGHSSRVMARALAIANEMGLSKGEKRILRFASFLHDIGKIDIDVSILRKPAALTKDEWKEIKKHPTIGSKIVAGIESLKELAPIILNHHARYEGGGYPNSELKGDGIPLGARILTVADAYESMTADRPYRKAMSQETAIKELKDNAGTQFDPKIVDVLLKILKK